MGNYRDPCDVNDEEWVSDTETRAWAVDSTGHGQRLDKVLAMGVPEFSRSYLQRSIIQGHVRVDGERVTTASRKVLSGHRLEIQLLPTAESLAFRAEPIELNVVFEDEHLLVLHKPAGLVVHPGSGNWSGTLLNGLLYRDPRAGSLPRAGIVHRLDKDTSGLMVVGRTLASVTELTRRIAAREVHREYLAIAHGAIHDDAVIQAPVGRDPRSRTRMAVVPSGKPARTDVTVLAGDARVTAVRCLLHSGRTHQIRVHMTHIGHPLVGDDTYGGKTLLGMTRQALHAWHLSLAHPILGHELRFMHAPPLDFEQAWKAVAPVAW